MVANYQKIAPVDEGRLAHETEIIKTFSPVAGVRCSEGRLTIMPRLPWLWNKIEVSDYPYIDEKGTMHRIDFTLRHERWLRKSTIEISGIDVVKSVDVRFGPYPAIRDAGGFEVETIRNASWK